MRTRLWLATGAALATVASTLVFWNAQAEPAHAQAGARPAQRPALAQPAPAPSPPPAQGSLDRSFGGTGQVVTDLTGFYSAADGVAVQPDGKIIAVGATRPRGGSTGDVDEQGADAQHSDILVVRYNPDGTPDPGFGTGGIVTTDLYGDYDAAHAVAVQDDGKIVVVGGSFGRTPTRDVVVVRYNADGSIDTSFSGGGSFDLPGKLTFDFGSEEEAYTVALGPPVQQEGGGFVQNIVVGGSDSRGLLLRLNGNGALDTSFAESGWVRVFDVARVQGIAVQPDGKIVGVGRDDDQRTIVFRWTFFGNPDAGDFYTPGFGDSGGVAVLDLSPNPSAGLAVTLSGTNIVLAGYAGQDFLVARYDTTGHRDTSFGAGQGYVTTDVVAERDDRARAVRVLPDGVVVAAGSTGADIAVVRYSTAGTVISTSTVDVGGFSDAGTALAQAGDGFVVAGRMDVGLGCQLAVLRYGANGEPDMAFGGDQGRATVQIPTPVDEVTGAALARDGGTVTVGYSATGKGWDFSLTKHDRAGRLDPSFGIGGRVVTDLGGEDQAAAVAVQPDGRIVVVGTAVIDGNPHFAVARYLGDGSLDPTFSGGFVITDLNFEGNERVATVALQPDGKIVVAGTDGQFIAVTRYLGDGTLDMLFGPPEGNRGIVLVPVGFSSQAKGVAVDSDGNIVVAADFYQFSGSGFALAPTDPASEDWASDGPAPIRPAAAGIPAHPAAAAAAALQSATTRDFAVVRLLSSGLRDPSFGPSESGVVTTDFNGGDDVARALALQSDGKILVAGSFFLGGEVMAGGTELVRYTADGMPDDTFGTPGSGGVVTYRLNNVDFGASSVRVLPGGGIEVAGTFTGDENTTDFLVTRFTTTGTGFITSRAVDFGASEKADALVLQPDGNLVVAGTTRRQGRTSVLLSRLTPVHDLDPAFGDGGLAVAEVTGDLDEARAVARRDPDDGKVVVAGESRAGPAGDFAVVRYNSDGTLDRTFGGDGRVILDLSGASDGAYGVVVRPDGRVVAAGVAGRGPRSDMVFVGLTDNGDLDPAFGDGGILRMDVAGGADEARALALQPDGSLVAAGSAVLPAGSRDFAVARVTAAGTPDRAFGPSENGTATMNFGGVDEAHGVALQADGKIVAVGVTSGDESRPALARFGTDGTPDGSFGDTGKVVVGTDDVAGGQANAVAVRPDGAIVIIGDAADGAGRLAFTARLSAAGVLDQSFGGTGVVHPALATDTRATAVAIQPDGAVVVAADDSSGPGRELLLLRYRADGFPDPSFGVDGVAYSGVATFGDQAAAVLLEQSGNLVAVGHVVYPGNPIDTDLTVLRFVGGPAGPLGAPADLAVALAADPEPARVNEPLRYTVTISNLGPGPATAVTLTGQLPATATLLATSGSQGEPCTSAAPGSVVCPVGDLAAGGVAGFTLTVQPTEIGTVTATVTVNTEVFDPDPANDSATVTSTVTSTVTPAAQAASIRPNPGVVALGRVTIVLGSGFVPGVPVSLGYANQSANQPGLRTVTPGPDGTFRAPLVIFAETLPGRRIVEVRSTADPTQLLAAANLLVVTDTLAPPDFVGRR